MAQLLSKYKFILFFFVSFLLYGNTLQNQYGLDDHFVTKKNNLTARGFASIKTLFTTHYIVEEGGVNTFEYRPIVKLSFAVEHGLFGVHPAISHFINVLLYALCLLVLYKALLRLFNQAFLALCITLIFAFIPLHAEVVASLKNRDILLCFIFSLIALNQSFDYISYNRIKNLLLAYTSLLIAFLSKLDALPYILIIPLVLYVKFNDKKIKHVLVSGILLCSFLTFLFLMNILLGDTPVNERTVEGYENILYQNQSPALVAGSALNSIGFYSKMLFLPINMACYYGYNTIPVQDFTSAYSILGMISIFALVLLIIKYRTSPLIVTGILFYTFSISMFLNILRPVPGIVGDRFAFFASIGFAIIITVFIFNFINKGIPQSFKNINKSTKLTLGVFLAFNLIVVIARNTDWKNEIHLYIADTVHQPNSLKLHNLCGNEILSELSKKNSSIAANDRQKFLTIADSMLHKAIRLDPKNIKAYNNLAYININYYKNYKSGIEYSMQALKIDSTRYEVNYNLAMCYYNLSDFEKSEYYALKAFEIKSEDNSLFELFSLIYSQKPQLNNSIVYFENELSVQSNNKKLNLLLANLYLSKQDSTRALLSYKRALKLDTTDSQLIEIINLLSK